MKRIKLEKSSNKDKTIFSLNLDYGNYHYSTHSKDEKHINSLFSALEVIQLGINGELNK